MITVLPVTLERDDIRLEPLTLEHEPALRTAAADGELWKLWFTSVPDAEGTLGYIESALNGRREGHRMPWVVRQISTDRVLGTTGYHDIVAAIDRVEIGWTWYAESVQRSSVNTTCKLMLLSHAFDVLGCAVVGFRTDGFNFRSQRAIEALGAKRDGVLRHQHPRRDGSARDTVVYSILATEWPDVRRHLELRLHHMQHRHVVASPSASLHSSITPSDG